MAWCAALAGPPLFLFWRVLVAGETFVERDLLAFHRASRMTLVRLWAETSGLPMWNPYFASGQPFAANPHYELFHPLTWLFAVLPFEWAFRFQVIVPVLLSALAMAFLLLTLGRSRAAALFGAVSWAYGGYLLSTTNLLPILLGASVAPALLAFVCRMARDPSPGDAAGLAASFAWMVLAGEPVLVLSVGLAAPVAFLHGVFGRAALGVRCRTRPSAGRRTAALAGALALGAAIGAGAILPGALLLRKTVRVEGLPDETALYWSLPPARVLELAVPRLLGHLKAPLHEAYWGISLYEKEGGPLLFSIYPGLFVAAAAAAAWGRRPSLELGWAAVAIAGYLLAIGRHGFLWPLARETLPLVGGFRYPEKLAILVALGVVVSGSAGFDLVLRRRRLPLAVMGLVLGAATLVGAVVAASLLDLPALFAGSPDPGSQELRSLARLDGLALLATGAVGILGLLVLLRRSRLAGSALLVLGLGLDVTLHGPALLRSAPVAEVDAAPPWVQKVLDRGDRDGKVLHLAAWTYPQGERSWLAAPPMPAYWGLKLTLEEDFDRTELAWSHRATETVRKAVREFPELLPPLLERRGVTAIVRLHRDARLAREGVSYPAGLDSPLDVAVARERARPAFLAEELRTARTAEEWLRELRALGKRAGRAVIVDGASAPLSAPPGPGTVERISNRPGRIEVDLRCNGPQECFLALTETWDEHWSARIDAEGARVYRTDLSLMGLAVPPGEHSVVLTYDDPSVRLGGAISAGAAVVGLGLALVGRRRHRHR